MKLSVKSLALTAALLWGGCILATGLVNLAVPDYGIAFLQMASSIYPGYHVTHSVASVVIGTCYGLADGAACGLVFAWVYNLFAARAAAS